MSNFPNDVLFTAVVSSNILDPYLPQDSDLAEVLKYPNSSNIHYPRSYIPAKEIKQIMRSRIDTYVSLGNESESIIKAAKQVVLFCNQYSDAQLCTVTFNCPQRHYSVWCGVAENQLHIICAMAGGHIPDYAFETPKS